MVEDINLNFYLKCAAKGLKYSLIVLLFIIPLLFLISLFNYSFLEVLHLMLKTKSNSIDLFSILEGIIIFIAVPIVISIKIELKKRIESN